MSWWMATLCTNVVGGSIIGFNWHQKVDTHPDRHVCCGVLVLGFYTISGEPFGDAVALCAGPRLWTRGDNRAFVGKAQSGKR